jgi:hypothetical protein
MKTPNLNSVYRGHSLIKGFLEGATTFGLIQKVAKDQDGKNLLPTRPTPGPVFRWGLCALWDGHAELGI